MTESTADEHRNLGNNLFKRKMDYKMTFIQPQCYNSIITFIFVEGKFKEALKSTKVQLKLIPMWPFITPTQPRANHAWAIMKSFRTD